LIGQSSILLEFGKDAPIYRVKLGSFRHFASLSENCANERKSSRS